MRNDDPRKEALRRNREDAAAERARLIQTAGEEEARRKIAALWPVGASGSIDGRPVTVVRLQTDPGLDSDTKPPYGRHVRFDDDGGEELYHVDDFA